MIFNMTGGVGKIKAIAVADADSYPLNAREGLVGVVTSLPVGLVHVQNEEPVDPENGDVWINTGVSSAASIKISNVTIYPSTAKQYVDGVWVSQPAKVFSNGTWAGLSALLFDNGNKCEDVVGEWMEYKAGSGLVEWGANALRLHWSGGSSRISSVYTQKAFDVSGFSALNVKIGSMATTSTSAGTPSLLFGLCAAPYVNTSQSGAKENFVAYTECKEDTTEGRLFTLDLSSVHHGEYFVQLYQLSCDVTIQEIYFS